MFYVYMDENKRQIIGRGHLPFNEYVNEYADALNKVNELLKDEIVFELSLNDVCMVKKLYSKDKVHEGYRVISDNGTICDIAICVPHENEGSFTELTRYDIYKQI